MRLIDGDALISAMIERCRIAEMCQAGDRLSGFIAGIEECIWMTRDIMPAKTPTVNEWISVKERLPEKDEEVIVCVQMENGMLYVTGAELWDDGVFWTDSGPLVRSRYEVTHWMPLPEPPEVEE